MKKTGLLSYGMHVPGVYECRECGLSIVRVSRREWRIVAGSFGLQRLVPPSGRCCCTSITGFRTLGEAKAFDAYPFLRNARKLSSGLCFFSSAGWLPEREGIHAKVFSGGAG
jgi:hypothetical protein